MFVQRVVEFTELCFFLFVFCFLHNCIWCQFCVLFFMVSFNLVFMCMLFIHLLATWGLVPLFHNFHFIINMPLIIIIIGLTCKWDINLLNLVIHNTKGEYFLSFTGRMERWVQESVVPCDEYQSKLVSLPTPNLARDWP